MNFKKYNEMELALLASIASMTKEEMENITVEKGDYDAVTMDDCTSTPFYITKPNAIHHAIRRKDTFRKKTERKNLARDLGYSMSTEDNSKKVRDLLSSNHSDGTYFRGEKEKSKHMTIKEETTLMEQEAIEIARDAMEKEHDGILGGIAEDIDTLTLDLKSSEYSIENLEKEYEALREEMELVAEKLKNAKLKRNGIQAALLQNKSEFAELSADFEKRRIAVFGW